MYDKIYGMIQSVDDFVWGWGIPRHSYSAMPELFP